MQAQLANKVIDRLNGLADSTGKAGVLVEVEGDGRIVVSLTSLVDVTLCRNGEPATGKIPFIEDV